MTREVLLEKISVKESSLSAKQMMVKNKNLLLQLLLLLDRLVKEGNEFLSMYFIFLFPVVS